MKCVAKSYDYVKNLHPWVLADKFLQLSVVYLIAIKTNNTKLRVIEADQLRDHEQSKKKAAGNEPLESMIFAWYRQNDWKSYGKNIDFNPLNDHCDLNQSSKLWVYLLNLAVGAVFFNYHVE